MIANKWYSIAQTTVFDTSCGINITFGNSSSVLFTASVKYGVSSLNISSCSIEESYNISVRLRETESKWCVDLLSNIEINPTIDITDSPYWVADNSLAGNGAVIAIIENISKEFNTTGGGGGGEGGESLFDRINIGTDANPQYAVVPKDFNGSHVHIVSYGDIIAGGQGEIGESGDGATTLGGLNNVDDSVDQIFSTDKVLIKSSLDSHWKAFDLSSIVGLDVDALKAYLNANEYATITDINNSVTPIAIKVDGYNDRILTLESLGLTIKEENGKKYLQSEYDFIGLGDIVAGGGEAEEDENEGSTLGSLYNVDESADEIFNTAKVLLKPINDSHWRVFDVSSIVGLDTNALKQYLDTNKYITETALEGYATTDDVTELSNSISNLRTDFDNLNNLLNDDTSGVIDTWNEVVDFLNGYKESEDLATILSKMNEDIANRVLSTDFNSYKTTTDSRISALESLGLSIVVENGKTYLKSEHSFCTEKDIFAGGLGEEGPSSGGVIQQVYGVSAFGGTFDSSNLTDTFNAHAINSLYTTIQRGVKNPYALTINGTPYDGSSAVDITISGGITPLFKESVTLLTNANNLNDYRFGYYGSSGTNRPANDLGYNTGVLAFASARGYDGCQIGYAANESYNLGYTYLAVRSEYNGNKNWTQWYELIHSGNIAKYVSQFNVGGAYLPLSGSNLTLTSSSNIVLNLNSTEDKSYVGIRFFKNGTRLGSIYSTTANEPMWNNVVGGHIMLHAGNYSSYALPLSGGTISGKTTISTSGWGNQLVINRSEGNGAPSIAFSNLGNGIVGYIGIGGTASSIGTKPFYEDASGNTYILLHSGNYSNYALPLSGGTIEGTVYNKIAGYAYRWGDKDNCFVGSNTDVNLYIGTSDATYINLYTSMVERMRVTATGNILMGTSTDWGYRLGVKGATFITGNGDHGILIGAQNNTIDGWRVNGNSTDLCLNWQSTGIISVGHGGGNVLIGSAYNSNAKLKVGISRTDNGWLWTSGNLGSYSDFTIEQDDKYGLYTRIERGAGDFGMQVGRSDGNALNYNLLLQPVGGNVLIGTSSDNGHKLQVNGGAFLAGNLHIKPSNGVSSLDLYVPAYAADSYSMIAVHASTSNTSQISMGIKFGGSLTTSLSYGLEVFNSRGNCYYNATAHYFTGNTQVTGNLIATGDITSGSSASDMRLKDIVCNDYDAVSIIKNLSTFKYKWNSTAKSLTDCFSKDNYEHFGLSAQEVEKVSGYLVSNFNYGEGREYLTLKKDELVPVLVQAVKQLLTRIEILEGK